MPRPPHIVFAGGGTRGQLYPGLAVAAQLAERVPHALITFVGGSRSGDRHVIRAAGFRHAKLPSRPAPESALHAVRFVTDNVAGYLAARWYLKEKHVTTVVGLGGAASAPTVRAAHLARAARGAAGTECGAGPRDAMARSFGQLGVCGFSTRRERIFPRRCR